MKFSALFALVVILTGCAHDRFGTASDPARFAEQHRIVADVTCRSAQPRFYNTLCDEFHMLAMPPRVRWTVAFRIDRVIKGTISTSSFRLNDARDRTTPFTMRGFYFQTNVSYKVGFDRITEAGVAKGLEILTNSSTVRPKSL